MSSEAVNKTMEELAKQLPVKDIYQDGLSPATRQGGQVFADIVKTLHLVLAPVQYAAALQDRFRAFIDRSVRNVPEERRIAPPPQILGPVLESIKYEPEDTPIDRMFSELLSRGMDKERVEEAHPAYPLIIRQLSSDEARILTRLKSEAFEFVQESDFDAEKGLFTAPRVIHDEFPRGDLTFPNNVPFYMDHLHQLGLAGIFQVGNQEVLKRNPTIPLMQTGVKIRSEYRLTAIGVNFVRACTSSADDGAPS